MINLTDTERIYLCNLLLQHQYEGDPGMVEKILSKLYPEGLYIYDGGEVRDFMAIWNIPTNSTVTINGCGEWFVKGETRYNVTPAQLWEVTREGGYMPHFCHSFRSVIQHVLQYERTITITVKRNEAQNG